MFVSSKTILASALPFALCLTSSAYADITYTPPANYQPAPSYQAPASYRPAPVSQPVPIDYGQETAAPAIAAPASTLPTVAPVTGTSGPPDDNRRRHRERADETAPILPAGTRSGIDAALDLSYYHYKEPSPEVKITGPQIGGDIAFTGTFGDRMFDTLQGHLAYGRADYNQPTAGDSRDHENVTWEIRDLIGKDFSMGKGVTLSPYAGLGYRNLFYDGSGISTNGYAGYERESQYFYLPLGVKPQFRMNSSTVIDTDAEFDYLLHGWQTSDLGDTGNGDPTVHNSQDNGYGFRLSAMWTTPTWSLGPYITYWNINDSSGSIFHSPSASCGGTTCVATEPRNITVEGGVQLKYHFLDF